MQKEPDVEEQVHEPHSKRQKVSPSGTYRCQFHVLLYTDLALIIISDRGLTRFPYSDRCIICNEDIIVDERHPGQTADHT